MELRNFHKSTVPRDPCFIHENSPFTNPVQLTPVQSTPILQHAREQRWDSHFLTPLITRCNLRSGVVFFSFFFLNQMSRVKLDQK